jgi:hypothetical protein
VSSFTAPLVVRIEQGERDGRGLATLLAPFDYHVGTYPSADVITVPTGFETDFCSIPRLLMPFFPILGRAAKAAVVHDWLIVQGKRPRREADGVFREAMGVLDVPPLRRWLMWAGVRIWGALRS